MCSWMKGSEDVRGVRTSEKVVESVHCGLSEAERF